MIAPAQVAFDAGRIAHVGSPVAGRVAAVKAQVSDPVKKGDELVVVESIEVGEAQSEFLQKQAAVESGSAALEPLKNAYERGKGLYNQGQGISLADLQKREGEYKAAQASLHTARASVRAAENKLRLLGMDDQALAALAESGRINPRFVITSLIDGVVSEQAVSLGQLVGPDKESLMIVGDVTTVWVMADVPEARVGEIALGSRAVIKLAPLGSAVVEGKVSAISPALDPSTRSGQVRIVVENSKAVLRPGMFAETEIEVAAGAASGEPVLAVPEQAVMNIKGAPAVFVPEKGEENSYKKRAVVVGPAVGGLVPVLSGLKEGEPVVVSGAFILKAEIGKSEAEEGD